MHVIAECHWGTLFSGGAANDSTERDSLFNSARRTYKDLQDEVLQWTGDEGDEGAMLDRVKSAITQSHERRLTNTRLPFMLWPKVQTFTTVAGQKAYSLHEAFGSALYFFNQTARRKVIDTPFEREDEFIAESPDPRGQMFYVKLHGLSRVQNQPAAASTITATSSNSGDNGKQVIVVGETATGIQEETLTLPNAGSVTFLPGGVLDVIKMGTGWAGTLTLTASDSTVLLTLSASQYGRQFRQLVAHNDQQGGELIQYQFFRNPKPLRYDNDIPDLPYPFDRILVLDSLIALQGFTRATQSEIKKWMDDVQDLEANMQQAYGDGNSVFSEANYQKLIDR